MTLRVLGRLICRSSRSSSWLFISPTNHKTTSPLAFQMTNILFDGELNQTALPVTCTQTQESRFRYGSRNTGVALSLVAAAAEAPNKKHQQEAEEEIKNSEFRISKLFETVDTEGLADILPNGGFFIEAQNLRLQGTINEGAYGKIWRGVLIDSHGGEEVAVKVVSEDVRDEEEMSRLLISEAEVLHRVSTRCHHVCRFYGVTVKRGKLCIIMKMYKKSLMDVLNERRKLPLSEIKKYGIQILKGLAELHEQGVIFQDLKPGNVLLDDLDNAVLADFGLSSCMKRGDKGIITAGKGTPSYMAPEAFNPEALGGMTTRTDMWSFGCLILELLTGVRPWKELEFHNIASRVKDKQERPPMPVGLPKTLATALEKCFVFHSDSRPDAREMLQIFLRDWEQVENEDFICPPVPKERDLSTIDPILPQEQKSVLAFDLFPQYVYEVPSVKPLYEVNPELYKGIVKLQHLFDGI